MSGRTSRRPYPVTFGFGDQRHDVDGRLANASNYLTRPKESLAHPLTPPWPNVGFVVSSRASHVRRMDCYELQDTYGGKNKFLRRRVRSGEACVGGEAAYGRKRRMVLVMRSHEDETHLNL